MSTPSAAIALGQHYVNATNAVALMGFVSGGNDGSLCTGTLLADTVSCDADSRISTGATIASPTRRLPTRSKPSGTTSPPPAPQYAAAAIQ